MSAASAGLEVLPCSAGQGRFAIPSAAIAAIEGQNAFKPSGARTGPLGFVQYEGADVPVYPLRDLMGLRAGPPRGRSSIVILRGEPAWAIAVEEVGAKVELARDRLYSVPRPLAATLKDKVYGVSALDDGACCLLDLRHLAPQSDVAAETPQVRPIDGAFRFPVRAKGRPQMFRFQLPGAGDDDPTLLVSAGQTAAALPPPQSIGSFGSGSRVLGMIAFQGIPAPVLDIGAILGLSSTNYEQAGKLLLVRGRHSGQLSALPVGPNLRLAETPPSSRRLEPPKQVSALLGAFEAEGEHLWALDIDAAIA